jgi:hypothetical protein
MPIIITIIKLVVAGHVIHTCSILFNHIRIIIHQPLVV